MAASANPVHTPALPFVPGGGAVWSGRFGCAAAGGTLQQRVGGGAVFPRRRHTGEVHALNLSGRREIIDTGEIVGPGDYVYEPPGNVDSWRCHGDEPCIVHITLTGRVEYLGEDGEVLFYTDTRNQRQAYLDWCAKHGVAPTAAMQG